MIVVQDLLENKQRQTEHLESMLELVKNERDLYVKLYRAQKAQFEQFRKDIAEIVNIPTSDDCTYLKVGVEELKKQSLGREKLEKAYELGEQHGGKHMDEFIDLMLDAKEAEDAYWDNADKWIEAGGLGD